MSEARPKAKNITRPPAETEIAFVEDFRWLTEMIDRMPPSYGEIRRSSAVMRRFFPDGRDFQRLCNFHAPRPHLRALDNRDYYRAAEKGSVVPFFVSGGRGMMRDNVVGLTTAGTFDDVGGTATIEERVTALPLEAWLQQKVLCFWSDWFTRTTVINYIANRAHGVHSGSDKRDGDESLSMLRKVAQLGVAPEGHTRMAIDIKAPYVVSADFTPRADLIDCVMFEYSCAVRFFVESPDAIALCDKLAAEHSL